MAQKTVAGMRAVFHVCQQFRLEPLRFRLFDGPRKRKGFRVEAL
jgi:hypothetical protein